MKKTRMFSRVLAIICTLTLFVSGTRLQTFASPENDAMQYEELGLEDFGFDKTITISNGPLDEITKTAGEGILHGVSVEGIYNFSSHDNYLFFGGSWVGIVFIPIAEGIIQVYHSDGEVFTHPTGYPDGWVFTSEEVGSPITSNDIKMKVAFELSNPASDVTDVNVIISINEMFETTITLEDIVVSTLGRCIYAYAENENTPMTLKTELPVEEPEEELMQYEKLTLGDFGFEKVTTISNGPSDEMLKTAGEGTLHGVSVEGIYNFSPHDNYLFFGGSWNGIAFIPIAEGVIQVYHSSEGGFTHPTGYPDGWVITSEEVGEAITSNDIKMEIAFELSNPTSDITNVNATISINETFETTITLEDIAVNTLSRSIYVYAENSEVPMTLKSRITELSLQEMGILNDVYGYTNGDRAVMGIYKNTLMNTIMTQKIKFSNHAGTAFIYAGAPNEWCGIWFETTAEGTIFIYAGANEFPEIYELKPDVAGTALVEEEIELSIELYACGDDAKLGVYINGELYNDQYFVLTNGKANLGSYASIYVSEKAGTVQIGDLEAAPTVNEEFNKLIFGSYGIYSDRYTYYNNDFAVSGHCGLDSMDGVIISDVVNFSKEPGAQLIVAGGETAWHGIIFESGENGTINLLDAYGVFEPVVFESETAGVELTGKNIRLTLSIEYVDRDGDGEHDDVKLGVWFDGKAYRDRWIYLRDAAPNLGGYIGIYCPNEKTYVYLETVDPVIDFTQYGFTENWAVELGLRKKS